METVAASTTARRQVRGDLERTGVLGQASRAFARGRYQLVQHAVAAALVPSLALWHLALERGAPPKAARRELRRRFEELLARDLASAESGEYPRELLFSQPWATYVRQLPTALPEMWRIWRRRRRGIPDEIPAEAAGAPYPSYYLRTFHWQTDGWLSLRSARLYDPGVELLFGGAADPLRRRALPPIVRATRGLAHPRVLDVGCGTGRLLAQLAVTLPGASLWGLDLSPYYIAYARQALADTVGVSLVTENAEAMPLRDDTFDAAAAVFLLHELPRDARRRVLQEIRRVLRPGGVVVVCDADQPLEADVVRPAFERFARLYHEPYFASYLRDPLPGALAECGLEVVSDETHFVERVVVGRKPTPSGVRVLSRS